MRTVLARLLDHLRWADALILEALREATPPAGALEIYGHVLGAEHTWLARLEGSEATVAVWPALDAEACGALAEENAGRLGSFLAACDDEALRQGVRYRNSAGREFDSTVGDILTHVAMHGQYHRGQVNLLLRQAGLRPAPVDYIAFVRGEPAATRRS